MADWTDKQTDFVQCQIIAVTGEDSYEVQLHDGRRLRNVSAANLRRLAGSRKPSTNMAKGQVTYEVGSRVRAMFPGDESEELYPGVIQAVHGNGRFSIQYDDGDFSNNVLKSMIYA